MRGYPDNKGLRLVPKPKQKPLIHQPCTLLEDFLTEVFMDPRLRWQTLQERIEDGHVEYFTTLFNSLRHERIAMYDAETDILCIFQPGTSIRIELHIQERAKDITLLGLTYVNPPATDQQWEDLSVDQIKEIVIYFLQTFNLDYPGPTE